MTATRAERVPAERFVTANGIRLHIVEHSGEGAPLILLPGLTGNARFFDGLVAAGLAPAHSVIAVDLRGRGLSDKPETGYSMEEHAADVVGLLDALGIERALLGGHSFGGLVSCFVAAAFPERVERCLVLDSPLVGERKTADRVVEQIGPSLARLERGAPSWEVYLASVKAQPYYGGWWNPHIERYYRADVEVLPDGSVRARARQALIAQCIEAGRAVHWKKVAGQVRQPVLLVRTTDPYGPPGYPPLMSREQAERSAAWFPDCRLVEVGGNHMTGFFGEPAADMVRAILAFVRGV